jgi:hypothetical protein
MYFPLPEGACRPALFHPDSHISNILVSQLPAVATGIVDWEFLSTLPRWVAYSVPGWLNDYGDKYEYRAHKAHLRVVFASVVFTCCYESFSDVVKTKLVKIRVCVRVSNEPIVELGYLVILFSQSI